MYSSLNNFDILEKDKILGEGSYSKVFKARNILDNKIYALKKVL